MDNSDGTVLGLDVGTVRVGVAVARLDVRLPQPLQTLQQGPEIMRQLAGMVKDNQAEAVVVGWPRDMQGNNTAQTKLVEEFAAQLGAELDIPVHLQDESLTSHKAEQELQLRGKPYTKGDVDALAAVFILEDYLQAVRPAGGGV